ncbi:MAG TPA: AMP-binding protein [Polyangiaceae bacterium]|nr:AMP-binding protein [Polyangiaceae bacterium]
MSRSRLLQRFVDSSHSLDIAVSDKRGSVSFAQLAESARTLAARIEREGLAGQRLALLAPPDRSWLVGFWAALLAGGTVVPLSPLHPTREQEFFVSESRAAALLLAEPMTNAAPAGRRLVYSGDASDAAPAAAPRPDEEEEEEAIALILYTSGTTGKPKGVLLSHANVFESVLSLQEAWAVSPRDRLVHALPLHHVHGISVALLWAFLGGAHTEMLPRYDPERVLAAAARSSVIMGVPTQHARLVQWLDALPDGTERARHLESLRRQRLITSGSAALPEKLGRRLQALSGQYPLERYGMTEVGIVLGNPLHGERVPGSVGQPLPRCRIRIVDETGRDAAPGQPGEIWIAAPSVFRGYDRDANATRAAFTDGFFASGDTAVWTQAGHVKILGRTSVDIIKSGGYKLSALELEEHLRDHAWVSEVAVLGVPDETWGERVVAVIVPSAALAGVAHDEAGERLRAWLKERIAAYKVPKQMLFWAELPRNAMGKVQKPALLAALGHGATSSPSMPRG